MRFSFVAKNRGIWPVSWICEALGVSRSGFHAWLNRSPSRRSQYDEVLIAGIRSSFAGSDRTYGARRVWHDVLAEGLDAGLHRIERLMRQEGLRARPRRRGLPKDAVSCGGCSTFRLPRSGWRRPWYQARRSRRSRLRGRLRCQRRAAIWRRFSARPAPISRVNWLPYSRAAIALATEAFVLPVLGRLSLTVESIVR